MKIERKITLILTIVFVIFIATFFIFGGQMREYFSPKVTYTIMSHKEIGGTLYTFTLPAGAVHRDENGEAYIWAILEDNIYGKQRSAVHKYTVDVLHESEQYTAIAGMKEILYDAKIAVDSDKQLEDDKQVVVISRAEAEKEG